jgi:hypothetical protein
VQVVAVRMDLHLSIMVIHDPSAWLRLSNADARGRSLCVALQNRRTRHDGFRVLALLDMDKKYI